MAKRGRRLAAAQSALCSNLVQIGRGVLEPRDRLRCRDGVRASLRRENPIGVLNYDLEVAEPNASLIRLRSCRAANIAYFQSIVIGRGV